MAGADILRYLVQGNGGGSGPAEQREPFTFADFAPGTDELQIDTIAVNATSLISSATSTPTRTADTPPATTTW